jgi:hypothetical protein
MRTLLLLLLLLPTFLIAQPLTTRLASFETDADNPFVTTAANIAVSRVADHASDGKYSLRVVAKGSDQPSWPALFLYPKTDPNWSARELLIMDVFVETPEPFDFGAQLCVEGRNDATTQSLGKLGPGWHRGVTLDVRRFNWNLTRVANLCFYVGRPSKDVIYYLDNVRWELESNQRSIEGWLSVADCGASGSNFQTTATVTAGSREITVADPGDFQVGQGLVLTRVNVRYDRPTLYGPGSPYGTSKPLGDAVEIRGYDGSAGSWIVYLLEVDSEGPPTFRWSDDLARTWKGAKVPITYDWQALSNGLEVKFKRQDWQKSHMVSFAARDQLTTTIVKIEGNKITLADTPNRSFEGAAVRHHDTYALQAAIDRAVKEKRNLYFPAGYYRLAGSLRVSNGNLTIEGQSAGNVTLDISDGVGGCLSLDGGKDVTVRNFTLIGHTGLAEAAGAFRMSNGTDSFWACALKSCSAVTVRSTERVLIENVHARRMASEAFYCQGAGRSSTNEPPQMTRSLTWLRCSAMDCAANGFNNNDTSENIYLLQCRVDGVGWHAYEGPARFIRLQNNYVRNAGPFTVGDMSHRSEDLNKLGCGQALVSGNVFEGIGRSEGITVNHGAGQVVISDNLFINYNGPAINASSFTVPTSYPSKNITITGNQIDMTFTGEKPRPCSAITVTAANTIVANNHIYVRGQTDPRVTALQVGEQALNVQVHDNLIENCGRGIVTTRLLARISEVVDDRTFVQSGMPNEWENSDCYRGWHLVWLKGNQADGESVIEAFDPKTLHLTLKQPRPMKVGDSFEAYPPYPNNWRLCRNTVTGCASPVILDSYGSRACRFQDNLITRGAATLVKEALVIKGLFQLLGNQISGFDEPGSIALSLYPDRLGQPLPNLYRDNVVDHCAVPVGETTKGLWEATIRDGNLLP